MLAWRTFIRKCYWTFLDCFIRRFKDVSTPYLNLVKKHRCYQCVKDAFLENPTLYFSIIAQHFLKCTTSPLSFLSGEQPIHPIYDWRTSLRSLKLLSVSSGSLLCTMLLLSLFLVLMALRC